MFPFFPTIELTKYPKDGSHNFFQHSIFKNLINKNKRYLKYGELTLLVDESSLFENSKLIEIFSISEKENIPFCIEVRNNNINTNRINQDYIKLLFGGFVLSSKLLSCIKINFCNIDKIKIIDIENIINKWLPFLDFGIFIDIIIPLDDFLLKDLENFTELFLNKGVSNIYFERIFNWDKTSEAEINNQKKLISRITALYRGGEQVRVNGCLPYCYNATLFSSCGGGIYSCFIAVNGDCFTCRFATKKTVGNVFSSHLEQIWVSEIAKEWRAIKPDSCADCTLFTSCRSGCRAPLLENKYDPLIKGADAVVLPTPIYGLLPFDESMKIILNARLFSKNGETFLINNRRIFCVSLKWDYLMHSLDHKTITLKDVAGIYKEEGVNFLFSLYLDNFVRFQPSNVLGR